MVYTQLFGAHNSSHFSSGQETQHARRCKVTSTTAKLNRFNTVRMWTLWNSCRWKREILPPHQTFKLKGLGHLLHPSHKYSPPILDPRHSVPHNSPIYSLKLLVLEGGVARVTPGEPPRPTECHAKKVVPGSVYLNRTATYTRKKTWCKGRGGWCQI